jgi:hypothetical protein
MTFIEPEIFLGLLAVGLENRERHEPEQMKNEMSNTLTSTTPPWRTADHLAKIQYSGNVTF